MLKRVLFVTMSLLMISAVPFDSFAQLSAPADWAVTVHNRYRVLANVTYLTATGHESKLDVYTTRHQRSAADPRLLSRRRMGARQ